MALVTEFTCTRCHERRYELVVANRVCVKCRTAEADELSKIRRMYLAGLTGLTIAERLTALEAHLYDLAKAEKARAAREATEARLY